jgi:hypothetical protein
MSFEALLTFSGVLLAAYAIARPVQRRSMGLFVPRWLLPGAVLYSVISLIIRDAPLGVRPPFGLPLGTAVFALTLTAFLAPVAAAMWSWAVWYRGKLTPDRMKRVEAVFTAALREREFDEVERIVRLNQSALSALPADAASALFHPKMDAALSSAHSLIHLELLSNMAFLALLEDPYSAVDAVVRDLMQSETSPLRPAVLSRYGGAEHLVYSERDRNLIAKAFLKPSWYMRTRADYPLTIAAIEFLESGRYDAAYNAVDERYHAHQGVSTRSVCPIYIAIKTEVLALEAAIGERTEGDFYITDLSDIFTSILSRSNIDSWSHPLACREYPTPYAYLLYQINHDLRELSAQAIRAATYPNRINGLLPLPDGDPRFAPSLGFRA